MITHEISVKSISDAFQLLKTTIELLYFTLINNYNNHLNYLYHSKIIIFKFT